MFQQEVGKPPAPRCVCVFAHWSEFHAIGQNCLTRETESLDRILRSNERHGSRMTEFFFRIKNKIRRGVYTRE